MVVAVVVAGCVGVVLVGCVLVGMVGLVAFGAAVGVGRSAGRLGGWMLGPLVGWVFRIPVAICMSGIPLINVDDRSRPVAFQDQNLLELTQTRATPLPKKNPQTGPDFVVLGPFSASGHPSPYGGILGGSAWWWRLGLSCNIMCI